VSGTRFDVTWSRYVALVMTAVVLATVQCSSNAVVDCRESSRACVAEVTLDQGGAPDGGRAGHDSPDNSSAPVSETADPRAGQAADLPDAPSRANYVMPIWRGAAPDFREIGREGINLEQAYYIVALVARHQNYRVWDEESTIESWDVEWTSEPSNRFFTLAIGFFRNVDPAENFPRIYYVSKMTGDVWSAVFLDFPCHRISFPALRAIQSKIRAKTGVTLASERQQRIGIECTDE
jgi:hypothetical protein